MTIQKQNLIPSELIHRVEEETQCLMAMRREAVENGDLPDIPEEQDSKIQLYRNGLTLIGKAWNLPDEAVAAQACLKYTAAGGGESETWILTEEQILNILWGLFDTAVRLDSLEDRQTVYKLAQEIMDFHGLNLRTRPA